MKTIFAHVNLKTRQFVALLFLILASAIGQMLLPAFLSSMISQGVGEGSKWHDLDFRHDYGCCLRYFPVSSAFYPSKMLQRFQQILPLS